MKPATKEEGEKSGIGRCFCEPPRAIYKNILSQVKATNKSCVYFTFPVQNAKGNEDPFALNIKESHTCGDCLWFVRDKRRKRRRKMMVIHVEPIYEMGGFMVTLNTNELNDPENCIKVIVRCEDILILKHHGTEISLKKVLKSVETLRDIDVEPEEQEA